MIRSYIVETTDRIFFNEEGTSKKEILDIVQEYGFDVSEIKSVRLSKSQ